MCTAALTVGRVLAALYVIGGIGAATDLLTRKSSTNLFSVVRGPDVLNELSLAALGVAAWILASSDAWATHRRRSSKRVEIEVAADG